MSEKKSITDIFDTMLNVTRPVFFSNSKYVGIEIQVSRKGWGFGAITLSHNLETGKWHLDDESTSKERVTQFLIDAAPQIVEALYDKGEVIFKPDFEPEEC